jgi:hypothetical protein
MRHWIYMMIPAAALACMSCDQSEIGVLVDEDDIAVQGDIAESSWVEITPGVWERKRADGGGERLSFGIEGLQFAIDRAEKERVALLELHHEQGLAAAADQLRKNQELIEHLQASLQRMEEAGDIESLPTAPPDANSVAFDPWDGSAPPDAQGSVCNGGYTFRVAFYVLNLANYSVESRTTWSEFGPYPNWQRTLFTYASAIGGDGILREDADSYGPFGGGCCASVTSSAIAGVTFTPQLYGFTSVFVTDGCSGYRSYEEWL